MKIKTRNAWVAQGLQVTYVTYDEMTGGDEKLHKTLASAINEDPDVIEEWLHKQGQRPTNGDKIAYYDSGEGFTREALDLYTGDY